MRRGLAAPLDTWQAVDTSTTLPIGLSSATIRSSRAPISVGFWASLCQSLLLNALLKVVVPGRGSIRLQLLPRSSPFRPPSTCRTSTDVSIRTITSPDWLRYSSKLWIHGKRARWKSPCRGGHIFHGSPDWIWCQAHHLFYILQRLQGKKTFRYFCKPLFANCSTWQKYTFVLAGTVGYTHYRCLNWDNKMSLFPLARNSCF